MISSALTCLNARQCPKTDTLFVAVPSLLRHCKRAHTHTWTRIESPSVSQSMSTILQRRSATLQGGWEGTGWHRRCHKRSPGAEQVRSTRRAQQHASNMSKELMPCMYTSLILCNKLSAFGKTFQACNLRACNSKMLMSHEHFGPTQSEKAIPVK